MRNFFRENFIHILLIVLFSLVMLFWGRIIVEEFKTETNFNNLSYISSRVRCAGALGWQVDKSSETKKTHYIPKESNEEFLRYNEMQKDCGFDLAPYMGKGVTVYTYRIVNFPHPTPVNAFLNLITYNNRLIGGDCEVEEFDELYLPIRYPK